MGSFNRIPANAAAAVRVTVRNSSAEVSLILRHSSALALFHFVRRTKFLTLFLSSKSRRFHSIPANESPGLTTLRTPFASSTCRSTPYCAQGTTIGIRRFPNSSSPVIPVHAHRRVFSVDWVRRYVGDRIGVWRFEWRPMCPCPKSVSSDQWRLATAVMPVRSLSIFCPHDRSNG